ncbi:helix-turn-helix domain-containing protein [Sedimentisphaera salicampi]|uniref:helix-turn-helix domain-containing protein n=1 Tax=Sedimentisphaera salicampi TaxID=1941349 RepID=UPI000B9C084A|nr:helix-turn-helix domain-containing protein [Sedimentisphaera salicampi]OXU14153.1 HTH-type transcriptional regulator YesS [Sedimentisphaera salicampi]
MNSEKMFEHISREELEKVSKIFSKHFGEDIWASNTFGDTVFTPEKASAVEFCEIVNCSEQGRERCRKQRADSIRMSMEIGQPYITICHAGILLGCVPVVDEDTQLGGLFFGKCLCENVCQSLLKDITKRLKGISDDQGEILHALLELPNTPPRKIHSASEKLYDILYGETRLNPKMLHWQRELSRQQAEIGEYIAEQKRLKNVSSTPYEYEKKLMNKVRIGDKTQTREILNCMLASIMLKSPGELNVLKARLLELISVLSRAAAEGGVDIDIMLERNLKNITQLIDVSDQKELCAWVGRATDDFIELVHDTANSRKISQIRPATEYIDQHYKQQITLSDVAKASHLSPSRLAHIFKEETGMTIVDYITQARIEQAKNLLLSTNMNCTEICFDVGYNNQSYFTRTFKELVGLTPRQFRSVNRSNS